MQGVDVRRAVADDAAEITRLGALMFESMGLTPSDDWRRRTADVVRDLLVDGRVVAFVVDGPEASHTAPEGNRGLVANAAAAVHDRLPHPLNPTGGTAYVQYVCTEATWRGRGLGRAVMAALLDWCRDNGALLVELHASPDGEPLYRSMGFAEGDSPALRMRLPPPSNSA